MLDVGLIQLHTGESLGIAAAGIIIGYVPFLSPD